MIGNGDLFSAELAVRRQAESRTDGIMIGRGVMGNPWIFRNIKRIFNGLNPTDPTEEEKHDLIIRHYQMMLKTKPEKIAVREMRKHIGWYIKGIRGAARLRTAINAQSDALSALKMIDGFFDSIKNNSIETDGVTE